MPNNIPYCTCTDTTNIINCTINENHSATSATATVIAESSSLAIGNYITISMGYTDGIGGVIFRGYVKQIERQTPDSTITITANDILVRAVEYFIAPTNPNYPLTYHNIQAETLVATLLPMAGLSLTSYSSTYFTLAAAGSLEVNLTSVYDYCKGIADLITWSLWADRNGNIYFKNRKPYPMTGASGQPGDTADSVIDYTPNQVDTISIDYTVTDKDLRNKIIVYGSNTQAEASASSPYLPSGFYRTAVIGAQLMIESYNGCLNAANYNLSLYNRLTKSLSLSVLGDYRLEARKCISLSGSNFISASYIPTGTWYIYSCEHSFSTAGFLTSLDLRQD
jgi:hypothetical protein